MANSTPIKRLPVELITEVFEFLDDIADVAHLARTSKLFSDIWKLHAVTICGVVLPRKIPFYEKVNELADAVIQQKIRDEGLGQISEKFPMNKARVAVWLSQAFAFRIKQYRSPHTPDYLHHLDVTECDHFAELYHELWMLTTMPRASAKAILESMAQSQLMILRRFGALRIIAGFDAGWKNTGGSEGYWDQTLDMLSQCFESHFRKAILLSPKGWRTMFSVHYFLF